jgi:hypothetical protein
MVFLTSGVSFIDPASGFYREIVFPVALCSDFSLDLVSRGNKVYSIFLSFACLAPADLRHSHPCSSLSFSWRNV